MEEQRKNSYPAHLNPFGNDDDVRPFGDDNNSANPFCNGENLVTSPDKIWEPITATKHVTQPVTQSKSSSCSKSFSTADFNAVEFKREMRTEPGHSTLHSSKSLINLNANPSALQSEYNTSTLRHKKRKAPPPPQQTDFVQVVTVVAVTTTTNEDASGASAVKPTRRVSQIKRSAEVDEKPLLSDTEDE